MDYEALIRTTNEFNRFMAYNGIVLTEAGPDGAVTTLEVGDETLNFSGNVHGGAYFTMADAAAGAAARGSGIRHVTLNSSFSFIRAVKSGTLRATAKVIHRGRTTCLVGVEVTDANGTLAAEGRFTMFSTGQRIE